MYNFLVYTKQCDGMVEKELEKELKMYLSLYEDEYTEDEIN